MRRLSCLGVWPAQGTRQVFRGLGWVLSGHAIGWYVVIPCVVWVYEAQWKYIIICEVAYIMRDLIYHRIYGS